MSEQVSAQIIPFPRRADPALPPVEGPQRLSNALTTLAQAMADQQEAVAVWRDAVKNMASQMRHLSDNLADTRIKVAKND